MRNLQDNSSLTRRSFLQRTSGIIPAAALAHLLGQEARCAAAEPRALDLTPRVPHFSPKAKSVIHLFMNGGPSQMDLFDPKPALDKHHGKPYADKIAGEVEFIKDAGGDGWAEFARLWMTARAGA